MRYYVVDTWNGGVGGITVRFVSTLYGTDGYNECLKWLHNNTSFSWDEALTRQGYKIEPMRSDEDVHS
jgi:hypothetical protein